MTRCLAAVLLAMLLCGLGLVAAPVEPTPLRRGDFFGMVTHYWGDIMPQLMHDIGANYVRVECRWADVQPNPNPDPATWDWTCPDRNMSPTTQGFYVLYGLGYAPSWANGGRDDSYPPTASHMGDWYHYCAELMRRYAGRHVVYSVWNEPNLDLFFMGSFDDYANLVRYASQAARAIDPTARLSGPETSNLSTPGRETWHQGALTLLGGMFDVVTTHWYCGSRCAPTSDGIAQQVSAYVNARVAEIPEGTPFWLTETGMSTPDDSRQAVFYDGVLKAYTDGFKRAARRGRPAWQNVFFYHLLADDDDTIVRVDPQRTRRQAFARYQAWVTGVRYAVPRSSRN